MSHSVFFRSHSMVNASKHSPRFWRAFRECIAGGEVVMRNVSQNATSLRAEARMLTAAGLILIAIGFPLTLILVMLALSPDGLSPALPAMIGAPPLTLGYLACHFASARLAKAKSLETQRPRDFA